MGRTPLPSISYSLRSGGRVQSTLWQSASKGFDLWWDYARLTELVLPDEYDRINLDLAPFFALPREEMKRRMSLVEDMPETFTLVIQNGKVTTEVRSITRAERCFAQRSDQGRGRSRMGRNPISRSRCPIVRLEASRGRPDLTAAAWCRLSHTSCLICEPHSPSLTSPKSISRGLDEHH